MRRTTALVIGGIGIALATPALADNAMQVCGQKYQAAKAGKTLPAGQTWNQFLAQCRTTLKPGAAATASAAPAAAPAPAAKPSIFSRLATAKPAAPAAAPAAAAAPATPAAHLPASGSPAMQAMHDRQRQCGQMWKADKAAGKIPTGQKWPQYWSACNTKLKG